MKIPNFFIVGASRSGTSTLARYLRKHPEIFFSEEKEPHHFCMDLLMESDCFHGKVKHYIDYRGRDHYLQLFEKVRDEKAVGEGSTWYLYSRAAASEIHKFNRHAKIIILLRNPADYLHSVHSLFLSSFNEDEENFVQALALENERKKGQAIPRQTTIPSRLFYSELVKYAEQVQRYIDTFPKDNVRVLIFEEFVNALPDVYRDILRFLEVDQGFEPDFDVANANKKPRFPKASRALKRSFVFDLYDQLMPRYLKPKVRSFTTKLYFKKVDRPQMDGSLREQLIRAYIPEIEKLEKALNRDLTVWK